MSPDNIKEIFTRFFIEKKIGTGTRFLLAVSGGMDSVVLCELCHQAGINFSIAHCNFSLRGEESDRDEEFVRSLAKKYDVEIFVTRFETESFAKENKLSVQEAARKLRYDLFSQLQKEHGFSHVLLAHHADDNIETLLMNFFRGTGLKGMTGIPEINSEILRPMLGIRRNEILAFAHANGLSWVEDSSNLSSKYTRNFFRNELLPAIKNVYPEVEYNLLHNIERFSHIRRFYKTAMENAIKEICEINGDEWRIPIRKIKKYDFRVIIYEIISRFGFGEKQVDEVISLMESESGKFIANDEYQVIKHGRWLVIAPRSKESSLITIEKGEDVVHFSNGSLLFKFADKEHFSMKTSEDMAQLDARHIEFPLVLRRWKQGDYFYPLGMRKKKKLARFLIDKKISKNQKEKVWVLQSDKKIIWVVGYRIDDRFKITESTSSIITITYQH
jgi:tRNA(Ile)-lysidine synthase